MVKLVAVTPSASTSVHETVREVVDVALRDTDSTPVERETNQNELHMQA